MKEGYKATETGDIPESWEVIKLGNRTKSYAGGTPLRSNDEFYINGSIPWVKSGEVNQRNIYSTGEKITEKAVAESSAKIIEPNSVLIALYGATAGNVGMLRIRATSNQAVLAINSNSDFLSNDYLYHFLKQATSQLLNLTQGSGQPNLSKGIIDNLKIPLPPLPEQQKIASILSTVDEKIENIDAQISQTRDLKKSLMQQLLTKGIGHTQFKSSELGEIPESWEVVKLGSIGIFSKGKGISKSELSITGIPCIRYGEIYTVHNFVVKRFCSFIDESIAANSKQIKKGDILFAGSGETVEDIGKAVAFVGEEEVYAGGDIIILSPQKDNSIYLSYCLNSDIIIEQRRKFGQGNAVVHIYAKSLAKIHIPIPPLKEQQIIASIFSTVDEKLESLQLKKETYQQLKKGLMQQLLTGKIRVNINEPAFA